MDNAKQQLADKLKSSNNVLVTVSRNPSVDQLSALIGLSLILNKMGKHCAAVFSGTVPSTIEFLKPESTIEKNTDSLRDFIIALDKSKADKLRYKVEDNIVRIFITPYKTSISEEDLNFSQGDFNVDVVVALGVKEQIDLDEAITAHGRILHDATISCINLDNSGSLGSINWSAPGASSLCELISDLVNDLSHDALDEQIATALLTGIVAETDRFSNDKTSSKTMAISGNLMAAGANQQLVATQLESGGTRIIESNDGESHDKVDDDGTLEIDHSLDKKPTNKKPEPVLELPEPTSTSDVDEPNTDNIDDDQPSITPITSGSRLMTEPPSLGGTLTASSDQSDMDAASDPSSLPELEQQHILEHSKAPDIEPLDETNYDPPTNNFMPPPPEPSTPQVVTPTSPPPPPPPSDPSPVIAPEQIDTHDTLAELEEAVHSPHLMNNQSAQSHTDAARKAVDLAFDEVAGSKPDGPIEALNAQPLGSELHPEDDNVNDSQKPPPVPPPIPFQYGNSS